VNVAADNIRAGLQDRPRKNVAFAISLIGEPIKDRQTKISIRGANHLPRIGAVGAID
jgi:hypothetical protein